MESYKNLKVWQKALDFTDEIYTATKQFPKDETYGLTSQLRRAVVSISANIAEGAVKRSKKEYARFLNISYGSLAETQTLLIIAYRQKYITKEVFDGFEQSSAEIAKMLNGLRNALEKTVLLK